MIRELHTVITKQEKSIGLDSNRKNITRFPTFA